MAGFLNSEDSLDPGDDFVGTWVGWLIQVDDSVLQIVLQGSL